MGLEKWQLLYTQKKHYCGDLITIFNKLFSAYRTELIAGGCEPYYRAAQCDSEQHQLIFREDYFASALHECAHWCIAGEQRRLQDDFGYWYIPEGRTATQQNAFYVAETKSQALEALFAAACAYPFKPSLDNLGHKQGDVSAFIKALEQQINHYQQQLPDRALRFYQALFAFYQPRSVLPLCSNLA